MGEKVYVSAGIEISVDDAYRVFVYSKTKDRWSDLSHCPMRRFGMAQFKRNLITVGGLDHCYVPTAKILTLSTDSRRWEELIPPMLTARHSLTVVTIATAIVTAGGRVGHGDCTNVEVYCDKTSQWYNVDPLPTARSDMSSVVIGDNFYLNESKDCFMASLSSLIETATSYASPSSVGSKSLWKTLPPTPLKDGSLASLSGSLMAVGGVSNDNSGLPAIYMFLNNAWVRLCNGDLPASRLKSTTVQLSTNTIILVGGYKFLTQEFSCRLHEVYIGSLHTEY